MKKIKLPQDLGQLGEALSKEEMQEIRIGGEQGYPKHNCVCIVFLVGVAGNYTVTSTSYTKTGDLCNSLCESRCHTYDDCYRYESYWPFSISKGSGSGSGSGSDCNCGSDCGSGSDCHCGSELEELEEIE